VGSISFHAPRALPVDRRRTALLAGLVVRRAFKTAAIAIDEALLGKLCTEGPPTGGPTGNDVRKHLDEERHNVRALDHAILELGGDPTRADASSRYGSTLASGLVSVAVDARVDLVASLDALLVAELYDVEAWPALLDYSRAAGHAAISASLEEAQARDARHLESARAWRAAAHARAASSR
jgi:hypothetical protein